MSFQRIEECVRLVCMSVTFLSISVLMSVTFLSISVLLLACAWEVLT